MPENVAIAQGNPAPESTPIPDYLIRDIIEGEIFYYKGYKGVINKTKTTEEIMATSGLQAEIVMYLNYLLTQKLGIEKYRIYASESGSHIAKNVNYGLDLVVYDAQVLTPNKVDEYYVKVPPLLVIEVDIKVDTNDLAEVDFILKKTESLLKFGAKKIVWVLSKSKRVFIAEPNEDWIFRDWNKDVELMNGIVANIGTYLKSRGISVGKK